MTLRGWRESELAKARARLKATTTAEERREMRRRPLRATVEWLWEHDVVFRVSIILLAVTAVAVAAYSWWSSHR